MLIYEKYVTETVDEADVQVRHLFGTEANVPSDSDNQLVYQDADGDTVAPTLNAKYLDDGKGGIIMVTEEDGEKVETFLAVNIKKADNSLINVVPGGSYEPAEKVLSSVRIEKANNTKTHYTVGDTLSTTGVKLFATFASGEEENVTTSATFKFDDSESTTATADDKAVVGSYTYPAESGDGITQVTKTDSFAITVDAKED